MRPWKKMKKKLLQQIRGNNQVSQNHTQSELSPMLTQSRSCQDLETGLTQVVFV